MTDDDRHVAMLLASEVVTDAVLHAHGIITCALAGGAGSISVAVSHQEPTPPDKRDGSLAERGPGRRLLAALAGAWGNRTRQDGQTVWFRVP